MRTLNYFITLFFLSSSYGAPFLEIRVQGKYSTEETQIFHDKSDWICKTELAKSFVSQVQPFSTKSLNRIREIPSKSEDSHGCREKVLIKDYRSKTLKEYRGCADEKVFNTFIKEIDKNCGRN